jgi:hypothetical protein
MSNTFEDQDYPPKVLHEVELPVKVTKDKDTVQSSSRLPTTSTHSSSSHASVSKRVGCWTLELPRNTILTSHDFQTCNTIKTNDQSNDIKIKDTSTHTHSGERAFAWKLSSPLTDWSLSSNTLLTVTYTQAVHAIPEYTNKNIVSDYAQRIFKKMKCNSCTNGNNNKQIYQEVYTANDILDIVHVDVKIRGFHECRAVQIILKSKIVGGSSKRFEDEVPDTVVADDTHCHLPGDGDQILKDCGYVAQDDVGMEDGIPIPPWCRDVPLNASAKAYGPILTFAMPNLDHPQQVAPCQSHLEESGNDSHISPLSNATPILWKVQFPPDPTTAIEAFTVLDGVLDVHPPHMNECVNSNDNNNIRGSANDNLEDDEYSDLECSACHPTNIYINGYQSWSFSGSVSQGDDQPKSAMPDFLSKAFNYGGSIPPAPTEGVWVEHHKNGHKSMKTSASSSEFDDDDDIPFQELTHYKSDFYTCVSCSDLEDDLESEQDKLDDVGGPAMVLGFLSQRKQFGLVTFDIDLYRVAMHASMQGVIASREKGISTDWAYCQILPGRSYDEEPMSYYLNAVCSYNLARPLQTFPPLTGWCSWYHYYENIDSETLCENFGRLSALKTKITSDAVIIDDGYMTSWGDWASLKPKGFPASSGGMKALAENIVKNGMIPGIWMAPYACDKNSKLAKEHPDWIIRNDEGRIANSSNCGKFFYGLDATNPAVREYAYNSIRMAVHEWGYKVLKLDFLYGACLSGNGKYDLSMSRAETMYLAIQTLRAAAGPDVFIIGCGCPIGPAIGYMDAMRVSADTGPTWYPDFPLPWWDHATLPSLRAMVRNSITRASLGHRFWHNDPDCILLGDTTSLTNIEIISAGTVIAMTGGMLLLSDDLSKLSAERLRVATRIFPVTGVTAVVLDLHTTSESGIPNLMRLWASDKGTFESKALNAVDQASENAKLTAFVPNRPWINPFDRNRTCLRVSKGLGSWSITSMSNWSDIPRVIHSPIRAMLPPKQCKEPPGPVNLGYHVFAFWSAKYIWISADRIANGAQTISKKLGPHESEIFHVKPVSRSLLQYVGSELHFTCGYEVESFSSTEKMIAMQFKNETKRSGFAYFYIPKCTEEIDVKMGGMSVKAEVVTKLPKIHHNTETYGGQIIRVWVSIHGSGSKHDGEVSIQSK